MSNYEYIEINAYELFTDTFSITLNEDENDKRKIEAVEFYNALHDVEKCTASADIQHLLKIVQMDFERRMSDPIELVGNLYHDIA
jgi:hypothetical protein